MCKVALILAEGFEEVEAVTPVDFLRRAGIEVVTVGLDGLTVTGSHGIALQADALLADFPREAEGIVIPGGMPGSARIAENATVRELVREFHRKKKMVAAICAAPALVLGAAGVLKGRAFTCYPGFESEAGPGGSYTGERVVRDGHLITGCGPGGAAEFAGAVIAYLKDKESAAKVLSATLQPGMERLTVQRKAVTPSLS